MRINARLDDKSSQMLAYLRAKTRGGTTDVIKQALALYYRQISEQETDGRQRLLSSDFIGCGAADPNLSSDYKTALTDSLAGKHGGLSVRDRVHDHE